MARKRKRKQNLTPLQTTLLVVGGLVLVPTAVVVGIAYMAAREAKKIASIPGTLHPTKPPRPTPTSPTTPTEPTEPYSIETLTSPYATVEVSYHPEQSKPYLVWASLPGVSSGTPFATQEEAHAYAQTVQWYFGPPNAGVDDILMYTTPTAIDPYHEARGAVWQSTSDGRFYYTVRWPNGWGNGGFYQSSDAAEAALHAKISQQS